MASIATSSGSDAEAELFVTDSFDDLRYLLMRVIRLVIALGSEVAVFCSFLMFARSGMWLFLNSFGTPHVSNTGKWYMDYATNYPAPSLLGWAVAFWVAWVTMYAVGLPYRSQTIKPGLLARRCHKCRIAIPDDMKCSNCKAIRPAWFVTKFLQLLNSLVTTVFNINDIAMTILSLGMGRK